MKALKQYSELLAWVCALAFPFFINPWSTDHFTICFFKWIGLDWCPGCGLGKSIAFIYRGEWLLSLKTHWFGIATVIILLLRIFSLAKTRIITPKHTTA